MHSIKEVQTELVKAGYDLGPYGPNHDGVDGDWGTKSITAMGQWQGAHKLAKTGAWDDAASQAVMFPTSPPAAAGSDYKPGSTVPLGWMPVCPMKRIIVHWTAGTHTASANDREHYHVLINGDGLLARGVPTIDKNSGGTHLGYAAHTLNCNSGSIGVSLACMGDAIENPFNSGKWPMTREQWNKLPYVLADLCNRYSIVPDKTHVLSHAEVQSTLGIAQRGKWDISRLSFDPSVIGAHAVGDIFRAATAQLLS